MKSHRKKNKKKNFCTHLNKVKLSGQRFQVNFPSFSSFENNHCLLLTKALVAVSPETYPEWS